MEGVSLSQLTISDSSSSSCSKSTYEPIKTFEELIDYEPSKSSGPNRSKTVILNKAFSSNVKVTLDGRRFDGPCPKTLVCHDFRGGYGDDRFVDGCENHENYVFRHWLQTDIFCYFSHHFVTIPPLGWINAAHLHGVKILGTLITEWDDGVALCGEMLKDESAIDRSVERLSNIVKDYGFEGYLINIENVLQEDQVPRMVEFLKKLTKALKALSPDNLVIWYDSVTSTGELKWQDCLNDLNACYFSACDGIYLNYGWTDEKLQASGTFAGDRRFDVYVGVDVFGRGCFGGGGTNTCQAVEKVANHNLSYAIFAPGWSFERHSYDLFHQTDDALWLPCSKYFYFRCLNDELQQRNDAGSVQLLSPTNCDDSSMSKKFKVFFATDFSLGYGPKQFQFGQDSASSSVSGWFNLSLQSFQPVILLPNTSTNECLQRKVEFDPTVGFLGGGSLRILNAKGGSYYQNPLKFCPIWFPLSIPFSSDRMSIAVLAVWKSVSVDHQPTIYLEFCQKNMQAKKFLLGSTDHLATSVAGKYYIHLKLRHFLPPNNSDNLKDVEFYFRKNNYDEKEIRGWRVSCYLFDMDASQLEKFSGINALRVGAEGDIHLGFLSLGQITHYSAE